VSPPEVSDENTGDFANLRPWRPGETGNPGGRRLALVNLALEVRRATRGGRELVDLQLSIARGEEIPVPGRARSQRPTLDQRQAAVEWLANRGWGKAKEYIEFAGEATPSQRLELLRRLSDEDRHQLREILARALSAPASDFTNGRADGDSAIQDDDREIVLPDNGTPVTEAEPVRPDVLETTDPHPPPSHPTN
jgi:hypothetical protein